MKGIFNNFKHDMYTVIPRSLKERQHGKMIVSCKVSIPGDLYVSYRPYACSDTALGQSTFKWTKKIGN